MHIKCGGKTLPEYGVQQEDNKTVSCWIPSEAGKVRHSITSMVHTTTVIQEFSISWKDHAAKWGYSVKCYMDGQNMGRTSCRAGDKGHRIGVRPSDPTIRVLYQFAPLITTGMSLF